MENNFFYQLVGKYLDGTASEEERGAVEAYYEQLSAADANLLTAEQKETLKEELYRSIQKQIRAKSKIIPMLRRASVAAIFIIALAGTAYLIFNKKQHPDQVASLPQVQRFKNDVAPAHKGVTLTLADGSKVRLDSASNGKIALQGKTELLKLDSSLSYEGKTKATEVLYNTVATAKGQDFHVRLADGTEVWLDAMSSIHFPTSFPGQIREVEITGQAYFEVAKDPSKPFKVKSSNQTIEVLGTHFNVNAYTENIKTTLLEGSVKISSGNSNGMLRPGEQSQLQNDGIKIITNADIEETMAWKNGRFHFDGTSVEEIMNQISRWYDIDVEYKDKISEEFVAKLPRDLPVSKLLNLLEMTKQVAFTIDGNKVTVMKVKN